MIREQTSEKAEVADLDYGDDRYSSEGFEAEDEPISSINDI